MIGGKKQGSGSLSDAFSNSSGIKVITGLMLIAMKWVRYMSELQVRMSRP